MGSVCETGKLLTNATSGFYQSKPSILGPRRPGSKFGTVEGRLVE